MVAMSGMPSLEQMQSLAVGTFKLVLSFVELHQTTAGSQLMQINSIGE